MRLPSQNVLKRFGRSDRTPCLSIARALWLSAEICLLNSCLNLQAGVQEPMTLFSRSGQFIVHGLPLGQAPFTGSTSAVSFVRLDPSLVAVSCEGIKQAFLEELGAADRWKGTVSIVLHGVADDNEPIVITSVHHKNGWNYRLSVPEQVNRTRFIKSIVQVLLFELANREASGQPAELPPWLVDGFARHLESTSLAGLTLEPTDWSDMNFGSLARDYKQFNGSSGWKFARTSAVRKQRRADPLASVRAYLRVNAPLTLDELNWPDETLGADEGNGRYGYCAHLFVHELLRLRNGRACLLQMIQQLHGALNWQTTFFSIFREHFPRLVDLDKWWALRVVQFGQVEQFSMRSPAEQWREMEDVLAIRAATQENPNELPTRAQLTLQNVVTDWDYPGQRSLLPEKIMQLRALEGRAQVFARELIEQYCATLAVYLRQRDVANRVSGRRNEPSINVPALINDTVKRLNELDAKRGEMKETGAGSEGRPPVTQRRPPS
jgi:hypothetical protein